LKMEDNYRLIVADKSVSLECPIGSLRAVIPVQSGLGAQELGVEGVLDYMEPFISWASDNGMREETFRGIVSDVKRYLRLVRRDVKSGLIASLSIKGKGQK